MNPLPLLLTIATCTAVLSTNIRAEADPGKGATAAYELKNRSIFKVDADSRIPFWPIGWQRPKAKSAGAVQTPVVEAPKVQLHPNQFNVSSILLGDPALATINGHSFAEGETLPVIYGTQRLRVIVRSIRDGGVLLDYEGQQTFVPMRRAELGVKQAQQKPQAAEFAIKITPGQP